MTTRVSDEHLTAERKLGEFLEFHEANPQVYALFRRFVDEAIQKGRVRQSADAILHRVRWETNVVTRGVAGFVKLSNNFSAYYSRLLVLENPHRAGFFEQRKSYADIMTLKDLRAPNV